MFFKKKKLTTAQIKTKTLRKEILKKERIMEELVLEYPVELRQRIEELDEEVYSLKKQMSQLEEAERGQVMYDYVKNNVIVRTGWAGTGKTQKTIAELKKYKRKNIILVPKQRKTDYAEIANSEIYEYFSLSEEYPTLKNIIEYIEPLLDNCNHDKLVLVIEEANAFKNSQDLMSFWAFATQYPNIKFVIISQTFNDEKKISTKKPNKTGYAV